MIIDFESEKLKRYDYQYACEELLENLLYSFCISDEDCEKEAVLKKFVKELNLGSTPLTHLIRTYFNNPDAQFAANNILAALSLNTLGNIVEFIETCWPQEKILVNKFKVLLMGFNIKKLKLRGLFGNSLKKISMIDLIEDYLLEKDNTLEAEILSPPSNILKLFSAP